MGPPVAGLVADKLGNFRLFMTAITFLNGGASLLLLTITSLSNNNNNFTLHSLELCCVPNQQNSQTICFDNEIMLADNDETITNLTCQSNNGSAFIPGVNFTNIL
jgi:hypothetical protein